MKTNQRNISGVKDSINSYRTNRGINFEQWTDFIENSDGLLSEIKTVEQAKIVIEKYQKEFPEFNFIYRKIYPDKIYRIFRQV